MNYYMYYFNGLSKKKSKEGNIEKDVKDRIEHWHIIRDSRVIASDRMYKYTAQWQIISFIYNIEAIMISILYLTPVADYMDLQNQKLGSIVATLFSLYVILVQYYISLQSYETKALRFHYQQIEIQRLAINLHISLKRYFNGTFDKEKLTTKYNDAINTYYAILEGTDNHSSSDYSNAKSVKHHGKQSADWSLANIFIWINYMISVAVIIGGLVLMLHK